MAGLELQEQNNRHTKQIGCMSTFFHIFDRQQILAGKRIHSAKRLPPTTSVGASPETASSGDSKKLVPDNSKSMLTKNENRRTISPSFDNQSRPRNVIARLMGLEPLPSKTVKSPAVPRSVDAVRSKYIDDNNFQVKLPNKSQNQSLERVATDERSNASSSRDSVNGGAGKSTECASVVNLKSECSRKSSLTHSIDFFPEPNQTTVITSGDFEKKLRMRGMDEQFNNLTALKQILQVLQHKGLLLHSPDTLHSDDESSIHLKHWRSLASKIDQQKSVNSDSRDRCRSTNRSENLPVKPTTSSPNRIESNLKTCNSIVKTKPLSIEIHSPPVDSTKLTAKKHGPVHHSIANRSPRNPNSPKQNFIKNVITDDESEISAKWESCREGNRLLERCGKLLHSISEMNGSTESPQKSATVLPSPVSVLDPGYDKDESSSPSESIDFRATFQEDNWSPKISPTTKSPQEEDEIEFISDDSDFIYISEILAGASHHLTEDPDAAFFSIEKRLHYNTENTSKIVSKLQRKLAFDVIVEILDRNRQLPPWSTSIQYSRPSVKQIWSEFQKIREINFGVLKKKDLVEINGWGDYPIETSEVVVNIERMIFKEMVGEAIGDLVNFSGECVFSRTRRRLVF